MSGQYQDQATNLEIETKNMLETKRTLNTILANVTGKTLEQIEKDTDRKQLYVCAGGERIRSGRQRAREKNFGVRIPIR
jgi:hypothetical protein